MSTPADIVSLSFLALREGFDAVESDLLVTGRHLPRVAGGTSHGGKLSEFTATEEIIDSLIRGFALADAADFYANGRAPVGYEHEELRAMTANGSIDAADMSRLAAGFSGLHKVALGDGSFALKAMFDYTPEGRAKARGGEFTGFSLSFLPPGKAQDKEGNPINEWVPIGGTLTNKPFVRGMAFAASEQAPAPTPTPKEVPQMDIKHLVREAALSEDATEADALVALHALTEKANKAEVALSEVRALTEERDALTVRLAEQAEAQKALTIKQAVHDGRIALTEGERFWRSLVALGEDDTFATFPAGKIPTANLVPAETPAPADAVINEGAPDAGAIWAEVATLSEKLKADGSTAMHAFETACAQVAKDPAKAAVIHPDINAEA